MFGTVAMTYRGSSFKVDRKIVAFTFLFFAKKICDKDFELLIFFFDSKVHSMNSPPCIMCTKIFPATEHGTCKIR